MTNKITIALIALLGIIMVFALVDCASGSTRHFEATVMDHHYVPARTHTSVTTDGEGHTRVHTHHHPEEFHLICAEMNGSQVFDVHTTRARYHAMTNGQYATVKTRQGRFTKIQWIPTILD